MKTDYSSILKLARTTDEADVLMEELTLLSSSLYKTRGETFEFVLKNKVRIKVAKALTAVISSRTRDLSPSVRDDKKGVEHTLAEIKEILSKLPKISLTIAFEPTERTIERIYTFLNPPNPSNSPTPPTLLELTTDSKIIAGAIIVSKGKYLDHSIGKKIDEYFNNL